MLHLTSDELHASAGRRIRGGDKGDIARAGGGEKGERAGVAMGKFGAFEILGGRRERRRERKGVSCVCRIADALTVPRACVTSPFVPRTDRDRTPLSPSLPPSCRPLTANRPSSIHRERGTTVLPLSSPSLSSPPRVYILASAPASHRTPMVTNPPAGLYVMSKCCEIIARKSDWQQTRNSSTRDARAARGGTGIWVRGPRGSRVVETATDDPARGWRGGRCLTGERR